MGIYIKDMEMPKRCEDCLLCEEIGGLGCRVQHLVILRRHGQKKPSWCPLVEVPPHGRLISADKAAETMMFEMSGTGYQSKAMRILQSDLYTPTVIESEE